jgi:hypothetical protein
MQQEKAIGTEKTKKDDIKLCNGWNRPTQREKKKKKKPNTSACFEKMKIKSRSQIQAYETKFQGLCHVSFQLKSCWNNYHTHQL